MSTAPSPTLVRAVRFLAGHCDGAQSEDGVGFNGTDTHFGRSLAEVPPSAWNPSVTRHAWKLIRKYRGQLAMGGIDYDSIPEPPDIDSGHSIRIISVDPEVGIFIKIPYGDSADPKRELGCRWDRPNKRWLVPARAFGNVVDYAKEHDLAVADEVHEFLREVANGAPIPTPRLGTVDVDDQMFVIRFDYHPRAVAAVKEIPGRQWHPESKTWKAPFTSVRAVRAFAEQFDLSLTAEADAVPDAEPSTNPSISVQGGIFFIRFDYDRDLVGRMRDIPSAAWNASARCWNAQIEAAIEISEFAVATEAQIDGSATSALSDAQAAIERIAQSAAHDAEIEVPNLGGELLPFQRAGVAYALRALGKQIA